MTSMTRAPVLICTMTWLLLAGSVVHAQSSNNLVGGSQFNPPLPPPPNVPKVQVPVAPKMDAPTPSISQTAPQPSFSEKVSRCLDEVTGFDPAERDAYTRSCVNR